MVDSSPYEWYGLDFIQHANSHDHGRVKLWMGSDHERENGQRQMIGCGEGAPYQPLGTPSSIQRFLKHLRNKRVTVHIVNVMAAAYLSRKGGTRSETLTTLTNEILIFSTDHGITLSPAYLPSIG